MMNQQHKRNEIHLHNEFSDAGSLSALIKELGYSTMSTVDVFNKIISQTQNITEKDVGELIGMMSMNHTGLVPRTDIVSFLQSINPTARVDIKDNSSSWNLDNFVSVMKNKDLNWKQVVACLDHPGFKLRDQKGLSMIVTIYKKLTGGEKLPLDVIVCRKWNNTEAQLSFILLALDAPPDIIDFTSDKLRHVDITFLPSHKNQNTTWGTIDLVETLLNLADVENMSSIKKVFEAPIKQCPEQFLLALAQSKPVNVSLQQDFISQIVPIFVKPHKNSFSVLHKLFEVNPTILVTSLSETYRKDPTQLRRILDIGQELKALDVILESRPFRFSIELAILASKRDHLNLDLWLQHHMERYSNEFVQEVIDYLSTSIPALKDKSQQTSFTVDSAKTFFKCLDKCRSVISSEVLEQAYQLYHTLDESLKKEISATEFQLSPEVEAKTNQFFLSMFHNEITVDAGIEKIKELKISKSKVDQEMFACVIHNLFDEYRFFSGYPEHELRVMAKLFGSIIYHNIIVAKTLKYGLICVLQAITSSDFKLNQFGLLALSLFKTRISEWSQFCTHLKNSAPQVFTLIPDLSQYVSKSPFLVDPHAEQFANTSISPPTSVSPQPPTIQNYPPIQQPSPVQPIQPPQNIVSTSPTPQIPPAKEEPHTPTKIKKEEEKDRSSPGIGFQLDISTLTRHATTQEIEVPDEDLADKMHFVINNLSQINLTEKCVELKNLLTPNLYPYISRYIVVNRASLEPNFHALYTKMLAALKIEELNKSILRQTYEAIDALLRSERITSSLSERSLLKNLGSWLGLQTVAKNKPVLQKDIDLKALLFDAFEKGKLIVLIPFVCKILNHCSKSKVLAPPNPWVMGIVSLLVEIHGIPELKLNLKFEVEMLCKTLKLNISQVEQQNKEKGLSLLAGRNQQKYNNPDIHGPSVPEPSSSTPSTPGVKNEKIFNILQISDTSVSITDLQDQVKISENLAIFKEQPELRKLVVVALDKTIREIISPVVKRAVTIACRTTSELVVKDFVSEPDYLKLQRSANLMVSNLASKLAMVSSKDLLKNNLQTHLRALFEAALNVDVKTNTDVKSMIDQIVHIVCAENINIGCAYVEQAARDKGAMDITETLQQEIEMRKSYQSNGLVAWTGYNMPHVMQRLPDVLVPKTGLHRSHLQVYEDFERKILSEQPREDMLPLPVAVEQAKQSLAKIVDHLNQVKKQVSSLLYLPPQGEITVCINKIRNTLRQSVLGGETAEHICQEVFYRLYEADAPIGKETYILLLKVVKDVESEASIHQITNLWKDLKSIQKLDRDLTISLVRADLLDLPVVDSELVAMMSDMNIAGMALNLLLHIIQKLIIQKTTISLSDLPKCLSFLQNHLKNLPDPIAISILIDQASKVTSSLAENTLTILFNSAADFESQERQMAREQLMKKFLSWVQIIEAPNNPSILGIDLRNTNASLYQVILESKEMLLRDLRDHINRNDQAFEDLALTLLEVTLEHFYKFGPGISNPNLLFKFADAYSELIGNLIFVEKYRAKIVARFHTTLETITRFIIRDHELQHGNFNQRIYLRLLSSLLHQVNTYTPQPIFQNVQDYQPTMEELRFSELNVELLSAFADSMMTLEPTKAPAFVFAWLELISHRFFMPKLLSPAGKKATPKFHSLIMSLFKFLEPYLRNIQLSNPVKLIYRASLKILLVLLHDFPEFLCDYHLSLCDVIPSTCIQMRNLILSAFPRHMRLPDPFTPNLKVDLLPDINEPPTTQSDYRANFTSDLTPDLLENFMNTRDVNILNQLPSKLKLSSQQEIDERGTTYNVPLINAVVFYTGILATRQPTRQFNNTPATDILRKLIIDLDSEGRYLVLNSLANQLRYPNNHTYYFSCVILHLFLDMADKEYIQEQITRVLIERLIVNRPHPWGLLITFIELVKNSRYKFWDKPFIRCTPDIDQMFINVRYTL